MTAPSGADEVPARHQHPGNGTGGGHGGHRGWAMLICCIPMVIAIVAIILSGR